MAKITPIDIIKGVSGKFGGNSREYFATNKTSYNIYFAKRVNDFQGPATSKAVGNSRSLQAQAEGGYRLAPRQPPCEWSPCY